MNKLMRTDIIEDIRTQLFALQDKNYREFHARLMPNIEKERIRGIRVPVLRKYAKELARGSRLFLSVRGEKLGCNTVKENDCDNVEKFLNSLPHYYYEENIAEIISKWTGIPAQRLTEDESTSLFTTATDVVETI